MNKIRNNSRKIVFIILAIIGLVSVLVTSYSFINTNLVGNRKYVITSGLLELALDEKDGIILSDALPVYDEVGMLGSPYEFTLTNKSKFTLKYELALKDETEGEEQLAYEDIRYGLTKDGVTTFGSIEGIDNMVIDSGSIETAKVINYEFRMWINHEVTEESRINGKSRTFKVIINTAKSEDDILLAATLDGEPVAEFPQVEDNYGVESITCTDGVSASFNPTTWSVTVDGITKSNTSCIVNFSSDITIDQTSDAITMSKSDLYAFYKGSFAGTATSSEVLSGKTVYLNGVETTGTMPNNGSVNATINSGETYTIPEGYHDGTGTITGNSLASQTSATATAAQITRGYTAWVNGVKITGTRANAITSLSGTISGAQADYKTKDYPVVFSTPFETTPTITLSDNYTETSITLIASSPTGFTCRVVNQDGPNNWTITWTAYTQ